MTTETSTQLAVVLLCATAVASTAGWSRYGRTIWPPIALVLLAATAAATAVPADLDTDDRGLATFVVAVAGIVAVVGGGPLTTWVFAFVDRGQTEADSVGNAGILKGGAWIGALERLAVFAGLAAGFPEGVAVVLALKGVGRYPDLRDSGSGTTTERFIIGTFTSILWAAACAGLVQLTLRY